MSKLCNHKRSSDARVPLLCARLSGLSREIKTRMPPGYVYFLTAAFYLPTRARAISFFVSVLFPSQSFLLYVAVASHNLLLSASYFLFHLGSLISLRLRDEA